MKAATNYMLYPSKKILIIATLVWMLAMTLLVVSMTDVFTQSFFQNKYTVLYLIMFAAFLQMLRLYKNYFKNH